MESLKTIVKGTMAKLSFESITTLKQKNIFPSCK